MFYFHFDWHNLYTFTRIFVVTNGDISHALLNLASNLNYIDRNFCFFPSRIKNQRLKKGDIETIKFDILKRAR